MRALRKRDLAADEPCPTVVPVVEDGLAVDPHPHAVIGQRREAIAARVELQRPCPACAEVVDRQASSGRAGTPVEVEADVVAHEQRRAAEVATVEVLAAPVDDGGRRGGRRSGRRPDPDLHPERRDAAGPEAQQPAGPGAQDPFAPVRAVAGGRDERDRDVNGLPGDDDPGERCRGATLHAIPAVKDQGVVGVPGAGAVVAQPPGLDERGARQHVRAVRDRDVTNEGETIGAGRSRRSRRRWRDRRQGECGCGSGSRLDHAPGRVAAEADTRFDLTIDDRHEQAGRRTGLIDQRRRPVAGDDHLVALQAGVDGQTVQPGGQTLERERSVSGRDSSDDRSGRAAWPERHGDAAQTGLIGLDDSVRAVAAITQRGAVRAEGAVGKAAAILPDPAMDRGA